MGLSLGTGWMRKLGNALALAGALGGSAQAQEAPKTNRVVANTTMSAAEICAEKGQLPVYSAVDGFIGCKPTQRIEDNTTLATNTISQESTSNVGQSVSPHIAYTLDSNGGRVSATTNGWSASVEKALGKRPGIRISGTHETSDRNIALGGDIIHSPQFKSLFLALGFTISTDITGMVTVSTAREDAAHALGNPSYQGNIGANSLSFSLYIRDTFIRFLREKGRGSTLNTSETTSTQVSMEDLNTYLRETIITTKTSRTTLWNAITRDTLTAGSNINIGDRWQLSLGAGGSRDINGTSANGDLNAYYYGGNARGSVGVHAQRGNKPVWQGTGEFGINKSGLSFILNLNVQGGKPFGWLGLGHTFGNPNNYTRPSSITMTPAEAVRRGMDNSTLHVNPSTLGFVSEVVSQGNPKITQKDTPQTPEGLQEGSISTVVNTDGSITLTYSARAGWNYEYQISNGAWTKTDVNIGTNNIATFTTPPTPPGIQTIRIREVHPTTSMSGPVSSISVNIQRDSETMITNQVVIAGQTTAEMPVSISDRDGVTGYTCQVYVGGTPVGAFVSPQGNTCRISGLKPGTEYTFREEAMVGVKKPNGEIVWQKKTVITPFKTTTLSTDTPESVTLPQVSVTSTSVKFTGGAVIDKDAPVGFKYDIIYIIKNKNGMIILDPNALVPDTSYTYTMQYNAWDNLTNTLIIGRRTTPQSFTTPKTPDTEPPTISFIPSSGVLTAGELNTNTSLGTLTCTSPSTGNICTYTSDNTNIRIRDGKVALSSEGAKLQAGMYSATVIGTGKGISTPYTINFTIKEPKLIPTVINFTPSKLTAGSLSVNQLAGKLSCYSGSKPMSCTYTNIEAGTPGAFNLMEDGSIVVKNIYLLDGTHTMTVGIPDTSIRQAIPITIDPAPYITPTLPPQISNINTTDNGTGVESRIEFIISLPLLRNKSGAPILSFGIEGLPNTTIYGGQLEWNYSAQVSPGGSHVHIYVSSQLDPPMGDGQPNNLTISSPELRGVTTTILTINQG